MHARSTVLTAPTEKIDEGIALVRDQIMPTFLDKDGCLGLSMLVDRSSGQCIVTTSWRDEAAMAATRDEATTQREEAARLLGGEITEVHEWELAVMHRAHPAAEGSYARSTWMKADPSRIDHARDVFRMGVLPRAEEMEGFCSASLMLDKAAGLGVSTVVFDSKAAVENTRSAADEVRASAVQEIGAEVLAVREYELALAHLHAPEMA